MKKFVFVSILICSIFSSCQRDHQDNEKKDPTPIGNKMICSGHHVNRYYKISDIFLRDDALKKDENGCYSTTLDFESSDFYGYRFPSETTNLFNKCAQKFEDTASEMRFPEDIDVGYALSCFIHSVEITSDTSFDEKHAAGASLNDLVEIDFATIYPCIKNGYSVEGLTGLLYPDAESIDQKYGIQAIKKRLDQLSVEELAMVYLHDRMQGAAESLPHTKKTGKNVYPSFYSGTNESGAYAYDQDSYR